MVGKVAGRITRGAGLDRAIRCGVALAVAAVAVSAAAAFAASHFRSGAVYTGKTAYCGSSVPGTTCVVRFRASTDGLSLRFVGKSVIDAWGCRGGGGEAVLGGNVKGATPIPLVRLRPDGTLHGSAAYLLRPTSAPPEHYTSTVTGHLSQAGTAAVITFRISFHSSGSPCSTQPVTITDR